MLLLGELLYGEEDAETMRAHLPILSVTILVVSLLAYLFDEIALLSVYDRTAIVEGEFWRLLSGNIVHFSGLHFSFNMIAFGIIGWIIEKRGYRGFALLILMTAVAIGASMILLKPDMQFYGGLSGIAHGAFVYLALFGLHESGPWSKLSRLILLVVPVKVGIELFSGASLAYSSEVFVPVPLSHLVGVAVAFLQFYMLKRLGYIEPSDKAQGTGTERPV